MQDKAFPFDCCRTVLDAGRHMYLKAGIARRARHRKAMREEIPILGDDIKKSWWVYGHALIVIWAAGTAASQRGIPKAIAHGNGINRCINHCEDAVKSRLGWKG